MIKRWTTVDDFITYGKTAPANTVVEIEGMSSVGDGGALKLYRTGNIGTPSQDFVTRGNNTCTDASGTEWEIIEGTIVTYDGTTDWFNNGFGSIGVGNYVLTGSTWVKVTVDTDLSSIESDIDAINSSITSIELDVTDINSTLLVKADYADLTKAQEELLPTGSKVYPDDGSVLSNGDNVTAGTTHLRVMVDGKPTILTAWDSLTLPATVTSVPVSDNGFSGYDVVTDQGTFEFVSNDTMLLRNGGLGWAARAETCTDVRGWGAILDGVTDITSSTLKAVNTLSSKIIFPTGKGVLSGRVFLNSYQTVEGAGIRDNDNNIGTELQATGSLGVFVIPSSATTLAESSDSSLIRQYCRIGKMSLSTSWDGVTGSPVGIDFQGTNVYSINDFHHLYDLKIDGFYLGIQITGRQIWTQYDRVQIDGCDYGMYANAVSHNLNTYTQVRITGSKHWGYTSEKSQTLTFISCNIERNGTLGANGISGAVFNDQEMTKLYNCYFENNGASTPVDNVNYANNSRSVSFEGTYSYAPTISGGYYVGSGIPIFIQCGQLIGGSVSTARLAANSNKSVYVEATSTLSDGQQVPFVVNSDNKIDESGDFLEFVTDANGRTVASMDQKDTGYWLRNIDSPVINLYRTKNIDAFPDSADITIDTVYNMTPGAELFIYNFDATNNVVIDSTLMRSGVSETILPQTSGLFKVLGFPDRKFVRV